VCRYTLSKTYELSAPRLNRRQLFVGYAGEASDITYSVEFGEAAQGANVGRGGESLLELPGTASTTVGGLERPASPGKFFVDSSSGEILARPSVSGNFIAILRARDGAGASVVVKEWSFVVQGADTATAANGPNGRGCANGEAVDSDELDRLFTCDCSRTSYSGGNCDVPAATASPSEVVAGSADSGVIVAAILVPLLALVIGAALVSRCRAHAKKNAPMDFNAQLQFLKDQGLIDEEEGDRGELPRVPRELSPLEHVAHKHAVAARGQVGGCWRAVVRLPSKCGRLRGPTRGAAFALGHRGEADSGVVGGSGWRGTAPNSARYFQDQIRTERATCGHLPRRRLCTQPPSSLHG